MLPTAYQHNVCRGLLAGILLSVLALSSNAQGDGIAVGKPKIFDNRALTLMLERLSQSLAQVQVVDQKSLAESLGFFQGSQTQEVSRSLGISTLPLPEIKTTSQANSAGQLIPSQQTTDRAVVNPSAPSLPDALAAPGFQPKYGPSANDLLSDQINLSYQIFNLRMLLERSLSDRLWQDPMHPGRIGQRLQAVIGFEITIDPPKDAKDSAAVVEITVAPATGSNAISLVAMMPQEKTYNSAALNSRSNAFGGSAVVKVITIGYSERHRGQIFYLFRDTDTISVERMSNPSGPPANAITFGWEFRPVLGRKSVSPGARQVFAVLAFPDFDKYLTPQTATAPTPQTKDFSAQTYRENTPPPFKILVWRRVYWRKYDSRTLTTSAKKKEMPSAATTLCDTASPCSVPYTATIQGSLQPHIRDVKWSPTDDKNAAVTVVGDNFFSGTSVYLGGTTLDSEKTGLLIKSDQDLTLRTTLAAIASGEAMLNGRYGSSVPLEVPPDTLSGGISINAVRLQFQPGRDTADLFVRLQDRNGQDLAIQDVKKVCYPLLSVGSTVLPPPYVYYPPDPQLQVDCDAPLEGKKCVEIYAPVPASLIGKDAEVKFKCPFLGRRFEDSALASNPYNVKVSRLGGALETALAIQGSYFSSGWKVELDTQYEVKDSGPLFFRSKSLLVLRLPTQKVNQFKNLVLLPPVGIPIVAAIPEVTPEPAQPKLTSCTPQTVDLNSSRSIQCTGEGLSAVTRVTFESLDLTFKLVPPSGCSVAGTPKDDKAECIRVFLTRRITSKSGPIEVLLRTKDDKTITPLSIKVQAPAAKPPEAKAPEKK